MFIGHWLTWPPAMTNAKYQMTNGKLISTASGSERPLANATLASARGTDSSSQQKWGFTHPHEA